MKNFIILLFGLCVVTSCKKESTQPKVTKLKSITYTNPDLSREYIIYRNSNELIDSIVAIGSEAGDYLKYDFYHTGERLDSILSYNSTNFLSKAKSSWTGNSLLGFWGITYTYNSDYRVVKKLYNSGSFFRVEHFADSSVYYYDQIGEVPEYKNFVQYYDKSIKNPFRLYKYENAYVINNFVFGGLASDFTGMNSFVNSTVNIYNSSGTKLNSSGSQSFSGNFEGYPTTMQNITYSTTSYTLDFHYE